MAASSSTASQTFDLLNNVQVLSPEDEIFKYDREEQKRINDAAPWKNDPHYFKKCKISAVALIKMVIHARSGVPYEIMGMMQGKIIGTTMVIMDSFALPVQGTETRVNAGNEAAEYMVQYMEGSGKVDPNRTISAGKVDIGAFRTYPENYKPPNTSPSEYQSIPLSKIEDFGVHANQYYQLEVEIFKSSLDQELLGMLWNKYWANTLSQSPLISNRAYAVSQLADLHQKLSKAGSAVPSTRATLPSLQEKENSSKTEKEEKKKEESQLAKSVKDSSKIAVEAQHGLIAQVIKDVIFSMRPQRSSTETATDASAPSTTERISDLADTSMSIG
ncbi:COP9 signalosome catalytic subunit rri1 [Marasmius tenuissimus]|uniref:COP9 signalosome complex subunit 5 n=1 Tax=Marasmius tenuissimus TaxID=585030 RepID=A0ABR3A568_9AGAR